MAEQQTTSPPGTVTFTLDGETVNVPAGTTILQAALQRGVYIPHYCYAPTLSMPASCRLCLVEVEKMPKLAPSCMLPAAEGMVVRTNTEAVEASRRDMMQFLLANHPLDCPVCDKGGECSLQRYAMDYGVEHSNFHEEKRRFKKPQFDPLLDIERNRCIMCTRCVRFDAEICDNHKIVVLSRGSRNYIGTYRDEPIGSIFSGNNIDLCPVGCWTSKPFRFQARVWELTRFTSACTYCSAGCKVVHWARDGRVYRTTPAPLPEDKQWDHDAVDQRYICDVGRFCSDYRDHPDRLVQPLVRAGAEWQATEWPAALADIARRLKDIASVHGPAAVGVIAGSRLGIEELWAVKRLAHEALGTFNLDWRASLACSNGAAAHAAAFAMADGDLDDVENYDAVFVVGAQLTETAPIVALRVKNAARIGKIKLYTAAARVDGWLNKSATQALQYAPGQDGTLLKGVLRLVMSSVTVPPSLEEELRRLVAAYPLERVAADCGVSEDAVKTLAQNLLRAPRLLILHDPSQGSGIGAADLTAPLGYLKQAINQLQPNKPGWHSMPVVPERNGVAAAWLGCQPQAGALSAPAMLEAAAEGRLKALLVFGACDFAAHPERKLVARSLSSLDLLVLADTFSSEVSAQAHFMLPIAGPQEQALTYGDSFRRLTALQPVAPPPGAAKPLRAVVEQLAARLGKELPAASSPTFADEARAVLDPAGEGRMTRPAGEGTDAYRALRQTGAPAPAKGCVLLWGATHYGRDHDGDHSRVMPGMRPEARLHLHPEEAARLGVEDGMPVELVMQGEVIALPAAICDDIPRGAVFVYRNLIDLPLGDLCHSYPTVALRRAGG